MESNNNTYKYLSVLFAIVAIVFAVLYFTKSDTVEENFSEISDNAAECRNQLQAWQAENKGKATTTPESRDDLQDILDNCSDLFEKSQSEVQ